VILITGYPDERVRDRAMRAGAASFLSKPISEANLISCLDRALKG
jgi:FixJ family two-component response regulator